MHFDYVALTWHTVVEVLDECYLAQYNTLVGAGWEQLRQAPFESGRGGVCIMRRPKEEPEVVEYEYVAVRHRGGEVWLMNQGWSQWMAFVWDDKPDRPAPLKDMVLVMRRPIEDKPCCGDPGEARPVNHGLAHPSSALVGRPGIHVEGYSDEPRMWAEAELLAFCKRIWREVIDPNRIVTIEGLGQVPLSSLAPGSIHTIDGSQVMIGRANQSGG